MNITITGIIMNRTIVVTGGVVISDFWLPPKSPKYNESNEGRL